MRIIYIFILLCSCAHKSEKKIESNKESETATTSKENHNETSNEQSTTFQKWEDTAPTITEEETTVRESATATRPERTIIKKRKITKAPKIETTETKSSGNTSATLGVSATVVRKEKDTKNESDKTSSNVGFKFRTWILLAVLLGIIGFVVWKILK